LLLISQSYNFFSNQTFLSLKKLPQRPTIGVSHYERAGAVPFLQPPSTGFACGKFSRAFIHSLGS